MTKSVSGLVVILTLAACAFAQEISHERVTFEPLNTVNVRPGQNTPVRFTFHVKQGFHINSHTPSMPELIPTTIHFSLPADVVIGRVQYPAGQLMSFPFEPTQKLSVYSGDVIVSARVVAPGNAATGTYTVHGTLKYQACSDNACYPPKDLPITFNVKVGTGSSHGAKAHGNAQSPHIHN